MDCFNSNELLNYAVSQGIINIEAVKDQIDMKKNKELLLKHPYSIWQGKNEYWYTRLPSEKGAVLKKRKTKEDIEKVVIDYYRQKENEPTFNEAYHRWIEEKYDLKEISKGTYDRYTCDFNRYCLNSDFGKMKIKVITERDLELFIRKTIAEYALTSKGYSGLRTIIKGVFKYARREGFTDISITNFMGDLELSKRAFKKRVVKKEEQIFEEHEIPIITQYLRDNPTIENLGILLVFETGLRVGELAALKPDDLISRRILRIQRTEIKYKSKKTGKQVHEVKDFPKTEAGCRDMIITERTVDTIEKIKAFGGKEYLFEKNGKRINAGSFGKQIITVCKKLGIPPRSMHKIRKTYATILIDSDVDESIIAEQMGHKDITCTKQYYYFSNKGIEEREAQIAKAVVI